MIRDALSKDAIADTIRKIDVQTSEEVVTSYREVVEGSLWNLIAPDAADQSEVSYESLNQGEADHGLLGFVDEGRKELPWWLGSFNWTFRCPGEGAVRLPDDGLDAIERLDPDTTIVERPELPREDGFAQVLQGLRTIREELEENLDSESHLSTEADERRDIPDEIFEFEDPHEPQAHLRTTSEFRGWVEDVLEICPPYHETMTALLYFNCGVPIHHAEAILDDASRYLENAGLFSSEYSVLYNTQYENGFVQVLSFSGTFDIRLSSERLASPTLRSLCYEEWRGSENYAALEGEELIEKMEDGSNIKLTDGEISRWAPTVLSSPFSFGYILTPGPFNKLRADTNTEVDEDILCVFSDPDQVEA